jgi:hypothetical protein
MTRLASRLSLAFFAVVAATWFGLAPASRAETAPDDKIPLRILYVGHPGSSREADFSAFLKQHFRQVNTGDLAGFTVRQTADADVVLVDYDGDGFKAPRVRLPEDYARPTVTIGVAGGLLCSQLRLKTGYL